MRIPALPVALAVVALTACGGGNGESAAMSDAPGFRFPPGDAEAGRAAFVDLRCHTCHPVSGDATMPEQVASRRGPVIGPDQAAQPPARIADSIIDPSHEIPPPRDSMMSPMGDYSEAMTVRQLIDLIAYVQSAGD